VKTYWLSFAADQEDGFLGVAVVDADDFIGAVVTAHAKGINPGGEVLGFDLPDTASIPEHFKNRLLSREDADAANEAICDKGSKP